MMDEEKVMEEKLLIEEGETVKKDKIDPIQSFTQPPARYTEAKLIEKLEK